MPRKVLIEDRQIDDEIWLSQKVTAALFPTLCGVASSIPKLWRWEYRPANSPSFYQYGNRSDMGVPASTGSGLYQLYYTYERQIRGCLDPSLSPCRWDPLVIIIDLGNTMWSASCLPWTPYIGTTCTAAGRRMTGRLRIVGSVSRGTMVDVFLDTDKRRWG